MKNKWNELKDRVKENFKNNKIVIIALLAIWIFAVIFTLFFYKDTLGKISTGNEFSDNVVELCEDTRVDRKSTRLNSSHAR